MLSFTKPDCINVGSIKLIKLDDPVLHLLPLNLNLMPHHLPYSRLLHLPVHLRHILLFHLPLFSPVHVFSLVSVVSISLGFLKLHKTKALLTLLPLTPLIQTT